ncbi:related to F-LANa protein [Phialocephala subalpina]|uniref:Derlin n=1 Tax=Phialocephala subalpina TaxID=576137 RepID=A0A1L7X529_9HELO|nr:related to F-LANa protein [Phialocephala subalpina]
MSPLEIFLSAPPISRTLAAVTFSFSVLLYTGVLPFEPFDLSLPPLIQLPPELWRLLTCLLITGRGLGILVDTYFLYVYGAKLEIASPRFSQRADFVTYICFSCGIILILNLLITSGHALASSLAMSFITTSVRDSWGQPITLIVLKMPAQYLPYAILFLTLIICSPQAAFIQATGLVAAHLYDLLTGLYPSSGIKRNLIVTPGWVKKMFGTQSVVERPYGTVSTGVAGQAAWGLDLSWQKFGPGRTLGGENSSAERQRPRGFVLAAMVMGTFLLVCGFSGFLFLYGAPDGWFSGVDVDRLSSGISRSGDKTAE